MLLRAKGQVPQRATESWSNLIHKTTLKMKKFKKIRDLFWSLSLPPSSRRDKTTIRTARPRVAARRVAIASHSASPTLRAKYRNQSSPPKEIDKSMKKPRPPQLIGLFSRSKLLWEIILRLKTRITMTDESFTRSCLMYCTKQILNDSSNLCLHWS